MKRPIHISLGPNYENDDVLLALKTLFNPLKWQDTSETEKLEREFEEMFPGYQALAVNSGRSAEYLILKTLGVGKRDEVIYQTFTCVAVPNSASWLGAKPVGVDMGSDYNIDEKDLQKKLTKKTKAIIQQNTFGIPANIKKLRVPIIDDQAHSLGIGKTGEIAFFSFGRDKIISSVFGGMIIVSDSELFVKLKALRDKLKNPPLLWTLQQLLHPIAMFVILPTYSVGLGKLILFALQKINLLSRAVYPEEKKGGQPNVFPSKMPVALAAIARHQLKKLERFNLHRKKIAKYYFENLKFHFENLNEDAIVLPPNIKEAVYLRFPLRVKNARGLLKFAKNKGVILGDWYNEIDADVVNLPTYPNLTLKDAQTVVSVIKQWLRTKAN